MPFGGIPANIAKNREEPRAEWFRFVETREAAQGTMERVLDKVLCVVSGRSELPRDCQRRSEVSGDQHPESLGVSLPSQNDQFAVCDIVKIHRFRVTSLAASRTVQPSMAPRLHGAGSSLWTVLEIDEEAGKKKSG